MTPLPEHNTNVTAGGYLVKCAFPLFALDNVTAGGYLKSMETQNTPNVTATEYELGSFDELQSLIDFEQLDLTIFGRKVPQPRLVAWYGERDYTYSGLTLKARPMPALLQRIADDLAERLGVEFDSVLCNLYRDGSDSVGWHADDESAFGSDPVIASLSFGGTRRFLLRRNADGAKTTFELADGTLLVMGEGVQQSYQHSVPKTRRPVGPRINLTFRKLA